jgi:hypothetical protein
LAETKEALMVRAFLPPVMETSMKTTCDERIYPDWLMLFTNYDSLRATK